MISNKINPGKCKKEKRKKGKVLNLMPCMLRENGPTPNVTFEKTMKTIDATHHFQAFPWRWVENLPNQNNLKILFKKKNLCLKLISRGLGFSLAEERTDIFYLPVFLIWTAAIVICDSYHQYCICPRTVDWLSRRANAWNASIVLICVAVIIWDLISLFDAIFFSSSTIKPFICL